ncbi:hypothetical protein WN51_02904 [Melipona quadrifasciata]|uniref:Uncharacterized protein n=1 Tax=Melipona quadrifasciata TaxID=166423 RepID=A0A0N0BJT8_9HYME|nr:hypothetical protein WN51_02904 [Melipona quadrifasciata]
MSDGWARSAVFLLLAGNRSDTVIHYSFLRLMLLMLPPQYRGAGGSSSGSPPASLLVVPQPLTVKPSHPSHLNPHLGGPHSHPPRKYQCKMCPQSWYFGFWNANEQDIVECVLRTDSTNICEVSDISSK